MVKSSNQHSVKNKILIIAIVILACDTLHAVARPSRLPSQVVRLVWTEVCSVPCTDEEIALWRNELKYELHDLNGDGRAEFFVYITHRDWCGSGFNCTFWVFQQIPSTNSYRLLASHPVLRILKTKTNGYSDLESHGRMGACVLPNGELGREIYVTVFKYNGKEYDATVLGEQCRPWRAAP